MNMYEDIKTLHARVLEVTPFCRAGSNPQVASKLVEIERLFIKIEHKARIQDLQIQTLLLGEFVCEKCGHVRKVK